jgi:hypothetical protein
MVPRLIYRDAAFTIRRGGAGARNTKATRYTHLRVSGAAPWACLFTERRGQIQRAQLRSITNDTLILINACVLARKLYMPARKAAQIQAT